MIQNVKSRYKQFMMRVLSTEWTKCIGAALNAYKLPMDKLMRGPLSIAHLLCYALWMKSLLKKVWIEYVQWGGAEEDINYLIRYTLPFVSVNNLLEM